MSESQNIEWKESWRDEYLKWICGFANANGGKLYIGTNDNGTVIGLSDAKKLLEDIPNKVRDILGIIVDVNLLVENGLEYIEIDVPPYSNPINYKGQYHYRTGSTKQELKGAALVQKLVNTSKTTAYRLLSQLDNWLELHGVTGKGTYYTFKGFAKGSILK